VDDFLILAWFFWNAAHNEGQVGFDSGLLAATGLGSAVHDTFLQQCSLSLSELRERLADERMSDAATPWMRYTPPGPASDQYERSVTPSAAARS
jgi:hypothetical protein